MDKPIEPGCLCEVIGADLIAHCARNGCTDRIVTAVEVLTIDGIAAQAVKIQDQLGMPRAVEYTLQMTYGLAHGCMVWVLDWPGRPEHCLSYSCKHGLRRLPDVDISETINQQKEMPA